MKEIAVISGKGGTGKTSIVASFAALSNDMVLADCDVDAPDLHLLLRPDIKETHDFSGGKLASITTEKCIGCGKCYEVCNFDAVMLNGSANDVAEKTYKIDTISCEGCGVCAHFCPADAIELKEAINGRWFISETRFGPMVHAQLGIGQENSGKLVSLIRKEAKQITIKQNKEMIIVDGSPGIGCPVIASVSGADLVLAVTEPTFSGRHDLDRILALTKHFKIPTVVCINKYTINPKIAKAIEEKALERDLKVVGKIAYDVAVTKAQIAGKSIVEHLSSGLKDQILSLWESVLTALKETINTRGAK